MNPLVFKAAQLAFQAHSEQKRKYSGKPYFCHLAEVAGRVMVLPNATVEMVCAAFLHDWLEDTVAYPRWEEKKDHLRTIFGDTTTAYIDAMTNRSKYVLPEGSNRATRKQYDQRLLGMAAPAVKQIKLIDRTANLRDMNGAPIQFLRIYAQESRDLRAVLANTDIVLENEFDQALKDAVAVIEQSAFNSAK